MPVYLSPEWLAAFAEALNGEDPAHSTGSDTRFGVRQRITGTPFGTVTYDIRLGDGRCTVDLKPDPAGESEVSLELDYDTAAALTKGRLTAQDAIATGRIGIRGELRRVVAARAVLRALDDRARDLRADTTYDPHS